jgi:hypothetical protein
MNYAIYYVFIHILLFDVTVVKNGWSHISTYTWVVHACEQTNLILP